MSAYNNGRLLEGMPGAKSRAFNLRFFMPVTLEKGSNIICVKTTSSNGTPRLRISAILDRSKEMRIAWDENGSLLAEKIIPAGLRDGFPALKWNALFDKLRVSVEVTDVLEGGIVLKKNDMRSGGILRDGPKGLGPSLYKITYNTGSESVSEYFITGSPREAFHRLKRKLENVILPTAEARLNAEALLLRGETLFLRENYNIDDRNWQEKAVHALGGLANIADMVANNRENFFKDIPGLHIRGFYSSSDGSKQFYRLFVPSSYDPAQAVPLLVIMPTPVNAKSSPFIISPFMADHLGALKICTLAGRHGFAVLWPGYRNTPEGWTCEATHVDGVLKEIEKNYNIDKSRVSVHGTCGAGYFAGRLVSVFPRRFAAIVYDRAVFDREVADLRRIPLPQSFWYEALRPGERVIDNKHIKIFVINDGSAEPGHGDMEWSEKFMEKALGKRSDVVARLGPHSEENLDLVSRRWDTIFTWLASCRNEEYSQMASDFLREEGYEGPVSEVFASPFIVIKGTSSVAVDSYIDPVIEHIKTSYRRRFHAADLVVKNDYETTEQDIKEHSLILVGNPESNAIWKKLGEHIPIEAAPAGLSIKGRQFFTNSAFLTIFKHPFNAERRILAIGSYDLGTLGLVQNADPCDAPYDCRIFEPEGDSHQTHTIYKLNTAVNQQTPETQP